MPAYIVVAVIFIVINYALTRVARFVEQSLRRRGHTAGPVTTAAPMIVQGVAEPGAVAEEEGLLVREGTRR